MKMKQCVKVLAGSLLGLLLLVAPAFAQERESKNYLQTAEAFRQVSHLDEVRLRQANEQIKKLSYGNMQAFRAFCQIPGLRPEEAVAALKQLATIHISFDSSVLFQRLVTLPGMNAESGWHLLKRLSGLGYVTERAIAALKKVEGMDLAGLMALIDRIERMDDAGKWAIKAYLEMSGLSAETIQAGAARLERMSQKQRWATEKLCEIPEISVAGVLSAMELLGHLSDRDAWSARSLFKQKEIREATALVWLRNYFSLTQGGQESRFFTLNAKEKSLLLNALVDAGDYLTWRLNNLHAVTDQRGLEISMATLSGFSRAALNAQFDKLDGKTKARFGASFRQGNSISVLIQATAAARKQAALDSTTPHIYSTLSIGSDLYDSSFREMLVPVLKERVNAGFGGNLLAFLKAVDPQNEHVSDFIINLAQRGKLTAFFPDRISEQKQILDLVAASAFQNENSLILFSATFVTLLQTIQLETRSYLIDKMLTAIQSQKAVFSKQLRVILQYYLQEHPQLVSGGDKARILRMMQEHGAVPLEMYTRAAFHEWKADRRLSSISVFNVDDDGHQSFRSNCQTLMGSGYRPRLSVSFLPLPSERVKLRYAEEQVRAACAAGALDRLYNLQAQYALVVDFVKMVNGIEISHSVSVYRDPDSQRHIFAQFLKGDHEMFAQRGHSYWRKEQLMDPLRKLTESGDVTEKDLLRKQRFLSLGSCGGVRAYSEIAVFFRNHVDILATVGTGKAVINDPYNKVLFELVASGPDQMRWQDVNQQAAMIFKQGLGEDYLQPGSLPAILHKIMDEKGIQRDAHKT